MEKEAKFSVQVNEKNNGQLDVLGVIDVSNAKEFEKFILDFINKTEVDVTLDFSNLEYISSAGLRCLVIAAQALSKMDRKFKCIIKEKSNVQSIFLLSGFNKIFDVEEIP